MDNIGLLLHKLTKYQTLLANVNDIKKQELYKQKISFYNKKMEHLGVDKQNLSSLNNLVGGNGDMEIVGNVRSVIDRLKGLVSTPEECKTDVNKDLIHENIERADKTLTEIEQNYNIVIETLNAVILEINNISSIQKSTGKCVSLDETVKKLQSLNTKLEKINNDKKETYSAIKTESKKSEPNRSETQPKISETQLKRSGTPNRSGTQAKRSIKLENNQAESVA